MTDKPRCQSCGMPLGTPGYYGTETDGTENKDWCTFCYKNGAFTDPDMTLEKMIDRSVQYMTTQMKFSEEDARAMSCGVLPTLKRWEHS